MSWRGTQVAWPNVVCGGRGTSKVHNDSTCLNQSRHCTAEVGRHGDPGLEQVHSKRSIRERSHEVNVCAQCNSHICILNVIRYTYVHTRVFDKTMAS